MILLALLVPVSYAVLVLCLLPAMWLLRWMRFQSTWSVAVTCGLATLLPGLALSGWFPADESKYAGATGYVFLLLVLPAVIAAAIGAWIHRIKL